MIYIFVPTAPFRKYWDKAHMHGSFPPANKTFFGKGWPSTWPSRINDIVQDRIKWTDISIVGIILDMLPAPN
jgi:hypothetical protein